MYIKECGYGRSKRRTTRKWITIGMCVLTLGMGGITLRVVEAKEQEETIDTDVILSEESVVEVESIVEVDNIVKVENIVEVDNEEVMKMEEDKTLIVIDPGHGGEDEGCSFEGVEEKRINLQIGKALRDKLLQMGYDVLITRDEDVALTLEERMNIANDANADIYVSIHQNACEEGNASGIETWYNSTNENRDMSKRLAKLIHNNVISHTDGRDRGLVEDNTLYVIRETKMPSCLIETGFLSDVQERQALCNEEYQNKLVEGIASGIDLYFKPKTMYLTFDDGPSAENTEKILDILKEKNIKATFFVIGENVRKNPEIARRIAEDGHTIGIHCNWHDYEPLYKDVESYVADFEQAYQMVYEVTGVEATIFRFPGGSINAYNKKVYKDIISEMTNRGFVYYDWNASLEDAVSKGSPEQLIQNAKESTLGRKKVVMLAHDTVDNTVLCLEKLLEELPEYKMEQLTEVVTPIQF